MYILAFPCNCVLVCLMISLNNIMQRNSSKSAKLKNDRLSRFRYQVHELFNCINGLKHCIGDYNILFLDKHDKLYGQEEKLRTSWDWAQTKKTIAKIKLIAVYFHSLPNHHIAYFQCAEPKNYSFLLVMIRGLFLNCG